VVKGICGICDLEVTATDERTKDDSGVYYHITCIKAEPNPQKFLSKGSEPKAKPSPALAPKRPAERRPTVSSVASDASVGVQRTPSDSKYEQGVQARHADFIARRRARLANKAKSHGPSPPVSLDNEPAGRGPSSARPSTSAAGPGPSTSQQQTREDQIREFKDRQRQAAAYRARLEPEANTAAPPASSSVRSVESVVAAPKAATKAGAAESTRQAAVLEYNERARRAQENRLRAEQDERGDGGVAVSNSPDDRKLPAVAPPPHVSTPAPSGPVQKKGPTRKKWQKQNRPVVSVAQAILDSTYCVGGSPLLPPISAGSSGSDKPASKAAAIQRRRELREMIEQSRLALQKQGGVRNDELPSVGGAEPGAGVSPSDEQSLGSDDGNTSPQPGGLVVEEDILGKSISRMLDDQVIVEDEEDEEDEAATPIIKVSADPKGDDLFDSKTDKPDQEDADYEGMLMHMSMVVSAEALSAAEKPSLKIPDNISEGGDDDDTWGDEGDDERACESIFSKMERVRAELERDLGFDKFLESYKILRGFYLDSDDVKNVEVPEHVRSGITGMMGDDDSAPASYDALLGLVKAENGIH
jgi:hypothetical protein